MHLVAPSLFLRGARSNVGPRIPHPFIANPSAGSKGRRALTVTGFGEGGKTSQPVLRTKRQNSVVRRDGGVFWALSQVGHTESVWSGGVQWRRARLLSSGVM